VRAERADKLFKPLRAARLDGTHEGEVCKMHRVELIISNDLVLNRLETTRTTTSTNRSSNATAWHRPSSPATANQPKS